MYNKDYGKNTGTLSKERELLSHNLTNENRSQGQYATCSHFFADSQNQSQTHNQQNMNFSLPARPGGIWNQTATTTSHAQLCLLLALPMARSANQISS